MNGNGNQWTPVTFRQRKIKREAKAIAIGLGLDPSIKEVNLEPFVWEEPDVPKRPIWTRKSIILQAVINLKARGEATEFDDGIPDSD